MRSERAGCTSAGSGYTPQLVSTSREDNSTTRAAAADALRETGAESVAVTEPGEWRLWDQMQDWPATLGVPVDLLADDRFIVSREEFEAWASGRRSFIMEHFYRMVRRKTGLLMDGDQPAGDRWNFDADNRAPAKPDLFLPQAPDEVAFEGHGNNPAHRHGEDDRAQQPGHDEGGGDHP